jgi:hypothetical protein
MEDKKIELSLGLVNGLMQYLGSRPYVEVADLILAIREQVTPQIQIPQAAQPEQDTPVQ